MQDKRESLEIVDQTQTLRYVSRFDTVLYVTVFTQKDFHYVHTGIFTKGPSPRNYNCTLGVYYSSLKHNYFYTKGIGTKSKQRKDYNLGDPMITNNTLITIDHK